MPTAARHLAQQRGMLMSLGNIAADSLFERLRPAPRAALALPGPELAVRVAAPSQALVDDFLRHVHGDPAQYASALPPQLFPQWGLAVALRALRGSGFPLIKLLNGGCRLESRAALRRGEDLKVRARLESVDDDGRRAVLRQRIVTEQAGAPDALVAELYGVIRAPGAASKTREQSEIPVAACKLEDWVIERDAGLQFGLLTGDFNPLHWLRPYARILGFRSAIWQGFAALARAYAGLERALSPLKMLDVRFLRPITLPARTSLYVHGERVFVGTAGEPPHLTGSFEVRS